MKGHRLSKQFTSSLAGCQQERNTLILLLYIPFFLLCPNRKTIRVKIVDEEEYERQESFFIALGEPKWMKRGISGVSQLLPPPPKNKPITNFILFFIFPFPPFLCYLNQAIPSSYPVYSRSLHFSVIYTLVHFVLLAFFGIIFF